MAPKNAIKTYATEQYYHCYNRGVNKTEIFLDDTDKDYFLSLFGRYLDPTNEEQNVKHVTYPKYNDDIELLSYCLMNNHFHILLWQEKDSRAIAKLMKSICTSYTMYFNKKYDRVATFSREI